MLAVRGQFTACEQRIERAPGHVPSLAVVGASYTAGVGPGRAGLSWAVDLARALRWDAVVYGVPGAGYVRAGTDGQGPMTRLLTDEGLPGLAPSLVIVQAGYDDGRVPAGIERQQVLRTIEQIRADGPARRDRAGHRLHQPGPPDPGPVLPDRRRDRRGGQGGRPERDHHGPADRAVDVPARRRGLHPTAAGDAWIAGKVEAILRAHGIVGRPVATAAAAPVICDIGVPAGAPDTDTRA